MKIKRILAIAFILIITGSASRAGSINVIPMPSSYTLTEGYAYLDSGFVLQCDPWFPKVNSAAARFAEKIKLLSGKSAFGGGLRITVHCKRDGKLVPGETESYKLEIKGSGITITAETDLGVMHAFETLRQLLTVHNSKFAFPCCIIDDSPRFPWRGLLIDVCRHYIPPAAIYRNLDAMAAVKMNVLHLHLSEDQGFRIESKTFPLLHEKGSGGNYYTQDEIKRIIQYAADRGIRVVPEFDMPGHATSWFVGYPQYASAPGPYQIETKYGVFDPTFNPADPNTYKFLDKFLTEMCALFPDPYFHIGGDENNGMQWKANPAIQEFMKKNNLPDNHALQAYFNKQLQAILAKNGKKMIGWDEILSTDLPKDIMIQSWRGKKSMIEAAQNGYASILSNGYYIDLSQPIAYHYLNDPLPEGSGLSAEQQKLILGGEATQWAELVTDENIDSRIWPRTAAIAERLWSPATTVDLNSLYSRMDKLSVILEECGTKHLSYRNPMLRRITGTSAISHWNKALEILSPAQGYNRHSYRTYNSSMPLTRLVDITIPDPLPGAIFRLQTEELLKGNKDIAADALINQLKSWSQALILCIDEADGHPVLSENKTTLQKAFNVSQTSMELLNHIKAGTQPAKDWIAGKKILVTDALQQAEIEISIAPATLLMIEYFEKTAR